MDKRSILKVLGERKKRLCDEAATMISKKKQLANISYFDELKRQLNKLPGTIKINKTEYNIKLPNLENNYDIERFFKVLSPVDDSLAKNHTEKHKQYDVEFNLLVDKIESDYQKLCLDISLSGSSKEMEERITEFCNRKIGE